MSKSRTKKSNKKNKTKTNKTKKMDDKARGIHTFVRKVKKRLRLNKSYSPTINQELVSLKSINRSELLDCNMEKAFKLKEPLKISVKGKCHYYYSPEGKQFLLHNLEANKHVDPSKIIPPVQSHSNCWFNSMFATFFISDKGRKFFHFLRQLMIEGKQQDGTKIPKKLYNAFALLNFGIDACLTGNDFAYKLNTNSIIHEIFKGIPKKYKMKYPYIVDVDEPGNPLLYYISIINYLQNNSIQLLFIRSATQDDWKNIIVDTVRKAGNLPHMIALEIHDDDAIGFNKKPKTISIGDGTYEIDSAVVRDVNKQHFCSVITCEDKEMGYDGASFHRLVPFSWKNKMNDSYEWEFEGTKDYNGKMLKWSFMKCYQILLYYRIK